jgi:hypothetical protein
MSLLQWVLIRDAGIVVIAIPRAASHVCVCSSREFPVSSPSSWKDSRNQLCWRTSAC